MEKTLRLQHSDGAGYVVPLGPVNLVWVVAKKGLVGCGAFDVKALEKFDYPAARVRPVGRMSVETLDDLLAGEIREANVMAEYIGIAVGMSGREALDLLS